MALYRGPGGSGDAVNDAASEVLLAISAREAAQAAQAAAEAAQVAAETAETNAETAETNAAASAALAAGYIPSPTGNAGKYLKTNGTVNSWDAIEINTADITGTLPIANGGTNATTAGDARTNLDVPSRSGSDATGTWNIGVTGNAGTATALATGRTIAITGDLAYTSPSFDGTGNVTAAGTLATVNSNTGSFGGSSSIPVITVNGKGLVTAVTTATVAGGQYFGNAAVKAIAYNASTINENITMTYNGMSVGAITIGSGYSVTVNAGIRWVIL